MRRGFGWGMRIKGQGTKDTSSLFELRRTRDNGQKTKDKRQKTMDIKILRF
jgi:hypothetical protein